MYFSNLINAIVESNSTRENFIDEKDLFNSWVVNDLAEFKKISDVVVANRLAYDISDIEGKVVTRYLFGSDS